MAEYYEDFYAEMFEEERRDIKVLSERERQRFEDDIKAVLSLEQGRRFVMWAVGLGGIFQHTFNGRALDQAYRAGQQSISQEILRVAIQVDPDLLANFVRNRLHKEEE